MDFIGRGLILCDILVNGTLTFTSANIVDGGFSLNRESTSAVAPELGNVSASELIILIDTTTVICNVQKGDIVTGKLYLDVDHTVETEFGEFVVTNVTKGNDTVEITCLDKMILLDGEADLSGITFPITAKNFINTIYGTGLGLTVEISNAVNDTTLYDPLFEVGTTYRQVLSKVCECMGANAWYKDKLYIGWYEEVQETADDTIYTTIELTETAFSIDVEVTADYTAKSVEIGDDVITLRVVDNPFLADYTDVEREALATAIKGNIGNVSWYGGSVILLPCPDLDVMSIITVVDKDGNDRTFPLTSITHGINENTKLESKISSEDNDYNGTIPKDVEKLKREIEDVEENNKHFFYRDDSGVHITMTENDWTTGRNLLMNSTNVDVRDGTSSLASFGNPTRIGEENSARTEISPTKFSIYSDNNDEAMSVTSASSFNAPVTERFTVATSYTSATLTYTTPVLAHTINWGTVRADTTITNWTGSEMLTLTFSSTSDTPQITGDMGVTVKGSIVGGNKVRLVYSNLADPDFSANVEASVTYRYIASSNTTVRLASDPPSLELINSKYGATSRIRAYAGNDNNGNNMTIQSGGNLFVGGGEYAENRYSYDMGENTGERLYLGADTNVYIESNANTIANRYTMTLANNGHLTIPRRLYLGTLNQGIYMSSGKGRTTTSIPEWYDILRVNNSGSLIVGYGIYEGQLGDTYIDAGQKIHLATRNGTLVCDGVTIDGLDPSNVGTTYEKTASTSLASGTAKNITSQSFAVGTWLVTGTAEFPSNATGRRAVQLSGTSGGDALSTQARSLVAPVNGAPTVAQFTFVLEVTATKTYYLVGYQNSGSALSTTGVINAVRIK